MSQASLNLRRELTITLIVICASVILLPGLIFIVGSQLFGAYGAGIAGIYRATLQDFLALRFAAWVLVLAPAACVLLLRLTFHFTAAADTPEPPAPQRTRREPTLNA